MNLIDVYKTFGTPEACNDFLERMRWPKGVTCLHCESNRVSKFVKQAGTRTRLNPDTGEQELKAVPARILYVCLECGKQFSVTEGTIFNDTHLSLDKWFVAVALMVNAKKGLSALQLKRDIKCAYKTAWYLNHRIRQAMGIFEAATTEQPARWKLTRRSSGRRNTTSAANARSTTKSRSSAWCSGTGRRRRTISPK
jgi:transposase-like protein